MKPEIKFIQVNKVPTKILVYDDGDEFGGEKFNKQRLIMLISGNRLSLIPSHTIERMLTGNPGEIEYYTDYLSKLYSEMNIPTIGISHAGHNRIPAGHSRPQMSSQLFGLEAQIDHKARFIRDHIEPSTRIILVGHSIGCYILLELLDRYPDIAQMVS